MSGNDRIRELARLDPSSASESEARKQVGKLREEIRRHDHLYYVKNKPEISDQQYDRLFETLQTLEEEFPKIREDDSPTQRIGQPPQESFTTAKHTARMLSLDSTYKASEVRRFHQRVSKSLDGDVVCLVEEKLDGSSLELVFEEGSLTRAVTRGDGDQGEDVTRNVRTIGSVPLRLGDASRKPPDLLAVRAEAIMELSDFDALNRELLQSGKEAFANPRNAASGSLRQLDPKVTAGRPLRVVAYEILRVGGASFDDEDEVLDALSDWGFAVPREAHAVSGPDEILSRHKELEKKRDDLGYEIDGIVIKVKNLAAREDLGATSHHPRWALAFKFEPRREQTRIADIAVQVGRTGALTPVALLRPVEVGGVTVSRASMHNRKEVERKDVRPGDLVEVQRAGDVIPEVARRLPEKGRKRKPPFQMPDECPSCGTEVEEDGPRSICPNHFGCRAQLEGRLQHFVSKSAMDIENLGEKTISALVDRGLLDNLPSLYHLRAEELEDLPELGKKSAKKLMRSIAESKRPPLHRFIHALGIPQVGASVSRDLAEHFGALDALLEAGKTELAGVEGIGASTAEEIDRFLHLRHTEKAIEDLLDAGVDVQKATSKGTGPLDGKRFVFTGSLSGFSRSEAQKAVESLGARATSSVSGETDYVVVGEGPGQKAAEAGKKDLRTLSEDEFVGLLEDAGYEVRQ